MGQRPVYSGRTCLQRWKCEPQRRSRHRPVVTRTLPRHINVAPQGSTGRYTGLSQVMKKTRVEAPPARETAASHLVQRSSVRHQSSAAYHLANHDSVVGVGVRLAMRWAPRISAGRISLGRISAASRPHLGRISSGASTLVMYSSWRNAPTALYWPHPPGPTSTILSSGCA